VGVAGGCAECGFFWFVGLEGGRVVGAGVVSGGGFPLVGLVEGDLFEIRSLPVFICDPGGGSAGVPGGGGGLWSVVFGALGVGGGVFAGFCWLGV